MSISPDFKSIHEQEWEINFTQCTANGFLKYTELSNLFQLTASKHSDNGGMSFYEMQKNAQAWVLSRIRIEIDQMPKWGDVVTVRTWIEYLDNGRSIRNIQMDLNGKKMAGASSLWAVLNTDLRKNEPLAINSDHLTRYPDLKATAQPFDRVNYTIDTQLITEKKVVLSDLDIVNHVNNVKYLEWCLDAYDPTKIFGQQIQSIDMNFLRELNIGDQISLEKAEHDNQTLFTVIKNKKVSFAAQIQWK